ncbi:S1 family peptidase [Nocardiopsis baichengensis]|uniref:S1 family peptidase n=1 Tax=Nocardiopsis baichengensis TaxID=280240 RepID=UPI00034990B0|nr:S1 family peptidase [Nocardiopsis baichengensis]
MSPSARPGRRPSRRLIRPLRAAAALGAAVAAALVTAATAAPAAADAGPPVPARSAQAAQADIVAGDPFFNDAYPGRCTIGAVVTAGFLANAHCGREGDRVRGHDGGTGTVAWSSPESGVLLVEADDGWRPTSSIRTGGGANATVRGTVEAPVGASVCRPGPTTGWRCGTIVAKNQTVRTPQGHVYNATRTSLCAEPGDTGGAFYSDGQLQGLLLVASGNCSTGGTSFFLPINPILSRYALTPVTG